MRSRGDAAPGAPEGPRHHRPGGGPREDPLRAPVDPRIDEGRGRGKRRRRRPDRFARLPPAPCAAAREGRDSGRLLRLATGLGVAKRAGEDARSPGARHPDPLPLREAVVRRARPRRARDVGGPPPRRRGGTGACDARTRGPRRPPPHRPHARVPRGRDPEAPAAPARRGRDPDRPAERPRRRPREGRFRPREPAPRDRGRGSRGLDDRVGSAPGAPRRLGRPRGRLGDGNGRGTAGRHPDGRRLSGRHAQLSPRQSSS